MTAALIVIGGVVLWGIALVAYYRQHGPRR